MADAWKKVGSLWKNDKGTLSIKLDEDLKKGAFLNLQDPRKSIDRAVERGTITEDVGETRKAKVPVNLKYELFEVPPKK